MLSRMLYRGLSATGFVSLTRRIRRGAVILNYHNVIADASDAATADPSLHLLQEHFEEQITWLSEQCTIVSLTEMSHALESGAAPARMAAITFDDGYTGVLQNAWPLLRSRGIPATLFVVSGAPDHLPGFWWDYPGASTLSRRRLLFELRGDQSAIVADDADVKIADALTPAGWDALATAAREGLEIGSHTATHRTLTELTDDELYAELGGSRREIWQQLGVVPQCISYPYGVWNERVRVAARAAGFRGGVTLERGLNTPMTDRMALHRVNIPSSISLPAFDAWSAGILQPAMSAAP